ncbi:hypothetical protein CK203_004247 [Vitis vinifera]|uniref:non-specific serine/threonine protein kinase n=1 Tax=Vitis vinifera TaxID=29760 RepID=A0A438K9A6_VITVI|nr:hypothetical protein CK203_004247 [Vitis vinifera]
MYCIGKGGHGSVYKAEPSSGNIVAVKKLYPSDIDTANQRDFFNEHCQASKARLIKSERTCRHIRIRYTSFGVIALEVIKGRHPGDQILSLSVSPQKENIVLEDMLDPRLPPVTAQDEGEEAPPVLDGARITG